jgi:hypothetical protein
MIGDHQKVQWTCEPNWLTTGSSDFLTFRKTVYIPGTQPATESAGVHGK